jgi:hypothetical protein
VGSNIEKSFIEVNEDYYLENGTWVQMSEVDAIVVQEATKERRD